MKTHRSLLLAAGGLIVSIAAALALTLPSIPGARAQAPVVLKIQASWPASLTIFEHLKLVAERVDKLSGGSLKIEPLPAGTIVPAFEVLDATSKKVIDGAHTVAYYWVGKNKTAVLFTGGPGGNFGMDFIDVLGWMYEGGGLELYQQFYKDVLKLNVVPLPAFPSGPQALGWFKRPIKNLADFKGMKCRQTGINAEIYTEMGMRTVNLPGGEILPAAERGVIDCAEWVGGIEDLQLGFHNVWKYHYTPGHARAGDDGRAADQQRGVGEALAAAQGDHQVGDDGGLHPLVREVAAAERRRPEGLHREAQGQRPEDAARGQHRVPQDLGQDRRARGREGSLLQEGARVAARVRRRSSSPPSGSCSRPYDFAANHYWPEKKAAAAAPAAPAAAQPAAKPAGQEAGARRSIREGPVIGRPLARAPPSEDSDRDGRTVPALLRTSASSTRSATGRARRSPG